MKITFFGTGTSQGTPMIGCKCEVCTSNDERDHRLRTSALIEVGGKKILIDAGPDFRQQMLRANVSNLDAILLTHEHIDHVGGLDDVRALNYINQKPIEIYAEERVQDALHKIFYYAFAEKKYPGVPEFSFHTINNTPFCIGDIRVEPIRVYHHKLPVLGFKIGKFAYITDANNIAESELQKIQNLDVLVIDALRREKHLSHFSLPETLAIIEKVKPRMTYLTHISHQLDLHKKLLKGLPTNVLPAYDTLEVKVED